MSFSAFKKVYGLTKPRTTPLMSADCSTLLKEKSTINARWREHFSTLLNRPSTVDPTVLDQIQQKPVITSLHLPQRSMKFRRRSNKPARENPLRWMGFLPRSSSQLVQWPSKHSTHSSPASGKERMSPKNSGLIMIALKGVIRSYLQSPHCSANRLQHVRSTGPGATVRKSRATPRELITCNIMYVPCHVARRDCSGIKFGRF